MSARTVAFVVLTAALLAGGFYATFLVSIGSCGMGPHAQQACYDDQQPWVYATIALFLAAELWFARVTFTGRGRGGKDS